MRDEHDPNKEMTALTFRKMLLPAGDETPARQRALPANWFGLKPHDL
jgi:hypothetical protein